MPGNLCNSRKAPCSSYIWRLFPICRSVLGNANSSKAPQGEISAAEVSHSSHFQIGQYSVCFKLLSWHSLLNIVFNRLQAKPCVAHFAMCRSVLGNANDTKAPQGEISAAEVSHFSLFSEQSTMFS